MCCDPDLSPPTFWPQNLIGTSMNPSTYVAKIRWNCLHWFLRCDVHKVFRTHRLTHGLTNPKTECLLQQRFLFQNFWGTRHTQTDTWIEGQPKNIIPPAPNRSTGIKSKFRLSLLNRNYTCTVENGQTNWTCRNLISQHIHNPGYNKYIHRPGYNISNWTCRNWYHSISTIPGTIRKFTDPGTLYPTGPVGIDITAYPQSRVQYVNSQTQVQCDFRFDLFFSFSFPVIFKF